MMRNRHKLIAAVVVLLVFVLGLLIAGLSLGTRNKTVVVSIDNKDLPVTVFTTSGFEKLESENSFTLVYTDDNFLFRFVNNNGVASNFYDIRDKKELVVDFSTNDKETPSTLSIEERFEDDSIELKKLKGYENDRWMIALAITTNFASDGSIGVYTLESGAYKEVFSGTGPDLYTLVDVGIPENVAINILEDYSALIQL